MSALRDLVELHEFRTGAAAGLVVAAVVLAVWLLRPRPRDVAVAQWAGVLVPATAIGALVAVADVRPALVVGVAGITLVAAVGAARDVSLTTQVMITVPFAGAVAAAADRQGSALIALGVFGASSVGAILAARCDDAWRDAGPSPVLLALAAFGAYLCTPDTEEVAAVLGVAVAFALLGWPLRVMRLGPAGAAGATAVLAWAVGVDARGRPTATVGALLALGVLWGWPLGREFLRGRGRLLDDAPPAAHVLALVGAQAALALVASRGVGLAADLGTVVVPALAVAAATVATSLVCTPPPAPGSADW
jgi:hypothetical protein